MSNEITINGEIYTKKIPPTESAKHVLIRTYSAGVHFGELVRHDGMEVELNNARRIWSWNGANTLSDIAEKGLKNVKESRISLTVKSIILTQAIEIIPLSHIALKSLNEVAEWTV
ncbi:hypothetical protein CV133_gene26 [Chlorobiaceae phage CV-1-33]|nr:hypothetical protein CV133_gene26 [Chlorobiaceae phage CV-1-33]